MIRHLALSVALFATPVAALEGSDLFVIDGDTVRIIETKETIRISNIDTPETYRSRCERELALGLRAKERLRALLNGPVEIVRGRPDKYGRTLARISANGEDVGEVLVREHLALEWRYQSRAFRLAYWCGMQRRDVR